MRGTSHAFFVAGMCRQTIRVRCGSIRYPFVRLGNVTAVIIEDENYAFAFRRKSYETPIY